MTWLTGTGHHRKNHRGDTAPDPEPVADRVHAEPVSGDMTIEELRWFVEDAYEKGGLGAGRLRPRVAVRFSGAVKGIWVTLPRD